MVKTLRKKFIIIAMISVFLVLTILMGIINLVNYNSVGKDISHKLDILAENGGSFPNQEKKHMPVAPTNQVQPQNKAEMRSSMEMPFETRYFTVEVDSTGQVVATNVEYIAAIGEEEAANIATTIYKEGSERGFFEDYAYVVTDVTGNALYIFIDCTRDLESFRSFLYASMGVSAIGMIAVFLLVFFLSKIVTAPVAESYEKQKRFITDASHEIKTPLAIIQANTEVLELTEGEDNKWIKSIQNQIERLTRLTERLVFLSRMDEEDNPILEKRMMNLSNAVEETSEGYYAMAKSKNREFFAHIDQDLMVVADESMMRQLVSLLLDNAMKYSNEGGRVTLSLKEDGNRKLLTVTNSIEEGAVTPGPHPEFFDRFYRADKSRNSKSGSFGIGLSVVKAIVDTHRGKVTAECEGTIVKFCVRLG